MSALFLYGCMSASRVAQKGNGMMRATGLSGCEGGKI